MNDSRRHASVETGSVNKWQWNCIAEKGTGPLWGHSGPVNQLLGNTMPSKHGIPQVERRCDFGGFCAAVEATRPGDFLDIFMIFSPKIDC